MNAEDFQKLSAPFPVGVVSWRIGPTNKKARERQMKDANAPATKGQALAYIDARDVMDRLDAVCGPAGWQDKYSHANGKTVCDIGIKCGDEWVWKADGAGDTDMEAEKGALSDAFKRAAMRWGIGRYLYNLPAPWVEIDEYKHIAESEMGRLRDLLSQVSNGSAMPAANKNVTTKSSAAAKRDGKWDNVVRLMREAPTLEALKTVAEANADWIGSLPEAWQEELRAIYEDTHLSIKGRIAA
jgi:hypothetical protein